MAKKKHQKTSGDKKNKLKNKMKFKYVIPDGLRDYYVNGVHGSVHPQGLINMHLFPKGFPSQNRSYPNRTRGGSMRNPKESSVQT